MLIDILLLILLGVLPPIVITIHIWREAYKADRRLYGDK